MMHAKTLAQGTRIARFLLRRRRFRPLSTGPGARRLQKEHGMTNDNQQRPQSPQQQQQTAGEKPQSDPSRQGGKNPQGQPGNMPESQGQPGARQSDQGSGGRPSAGQSDRDTQKFQGGQSPNRQSGYEDDNSPGNEAGDQAAGQNVRRGALDAQYGTDSSSKTGQQSSKPEASSGSSTSAGASESSTGADRDTMTGSRNKGR